MRRAHTPLELRTLDAVADWLASRHAVCTVAGWRMGRQADEKEQSMRFVPLAAAGGFLVTVAIPAFAACFATEQYVQAREALAGLPSDRERALLDPRAADAYDDLEVALEAFLATAGQECREARPAKALLDDAADVLVAATSADVGDDPWFTFCLITAEPHCLQACIDGLVCD